MIPLLIAPDILHTHRAGELSARFSVADCADGLHLLLEENGLSLRDGSQALRGDFVHLVPRLKGGGLQRELLVRAAKIKDPDHPLTAIDATAGLGEDSFFLAAAGFTVTLYERDPVVFALLEDALLRAKADGALREIVSRMHAVHGNSAEAMLTLGSSPDVVLLDPMFPQRQKSALVKKKLQMIQRLEPPCSDEAGLLWAAITAGPRKLIIKRPPKGPYLAGVKPDHSIEGKAVRFDCLVDPALRAHKLREMLFPEDRGR